MNPVMRHARSLLLENLRKRVEIGTDLTCFFDSTSVVFSDFSEISGISISSIRVVLWF